MDLTELALLVKHARDKQKQYFRDRDATTLRESKDLERHLDWAVEAILHPPAPGLFEKE